MVSRVSASRPSCGKGQLYHYFDDKPDLVLAVIPAQIGRALQLEGNNLAAIHCAQDLRNWGRHLIDQHNHGGPVRCPLGALVIELADNHPEMREALDRGFTRWNVLITDALRRLQAGDEIHAASDPEELAELLLCAYEGGVLLSEVRGTIRPLEIAVNTTIDAILV